MADLTLDMLRALGGQLDTFTVCPVHGSINGVVDNIEGRRWQTCDCHSERESEWPTAFDIRMLAELCHTCGAGLIRSGSRWSLFHCELCMGVWRARREADLVTPLFGRHTIMNRVPVDPDDPDVADGIRRMAAGIDALDEYRVGLVKRVIDEETPLVEYLELADPSSPEAWLAAVGLS